MAWYWWVLIAIGVVLIGWLKLTVLGKWMDKRKAQQASMEDDE